MLFDLRDFVFKYIVDHQIEKLKKSDTKITKYVDLIFPDCFVRYMENHDPFDDVKNKDKTDGYEPMSTYERLV